MKMTVKKGSDIIEIEVLDDGTIKTSTNKISMPNHQNAEAFLRTTSELAGGKVEVKQKKGSKMHEHDGVYHEH
jgi:hypothetical protein